MARRRSSSLASSLRPAPLFLLLLTLCLSYSACAFQLLPGRDRFHEGERIDVFVETVQGVGIGLHDLPLCQSPDLAVVPPRRFVDLVRLKPPLYRTIYGQQVKKPCSQPYRCSIAGLAVLSGESLNDSRTAPSRARHSFCLDSLAHHLNWMLFVQMSRC